MAIWIAAVLLIAAVALFVAAPLTDGLAGIIPLTRARGAARVNQDRGRSFIIELEELEHRRALAVQGLRELEFDHAMGKLDGPDYRSLRRGLEAQALHAMSALQNAAEPSSIVSEGSQPSGTATKFCSRCGAVSDFVHSFCANCGAGFRHLAT